MCAKSKWSQRHGNVCGNCEGGKPVNSKLPLLDDPSESVRLWGGPGEPFASLMLRGSPRGRLFLALYKFTDPSLCLLSTLATFGPPPHSCQSLTRQPPTDQTVPQSNRPRGAPSLQKHLPRAHIRGLLRPLMLPLPQMVAGYPLSGRERLSTADHVG